MQFKMDEKFVKIFKAQTELISQQFILLFKGLCEINPKFGDSNGESAEWYDKLQSLFEEVRILAFVAAIPEEMKDMREMSRKFVERYSRPDECSLMILLEECCSYSEKKDENKTFDSHSKVKIEPENYVNNVSRVEHIQSSQFKFVKIFKAQTELISQQFILLFKGLCEINPKFGDSNGESAEWYDKLQSLFEEVRILAFVAAIPEEMKDMREMSRKFVERYSRPDECSLMILLEECCSYSEKKDENKTFDSHSKVKIEPENYVNNVSRVEHIQSSQFGNSRNNSGQRKRQFKIRDSSQCYKCGMIGHISRDCRKPKKRLSQGKSPKVNHVKVDSSYSRPHCLTVEIPELKDSNQNSRSSIIQGRKPKIRKEKT
uniref:CCHC-type domain-containing protein n=1 Tax=Meloidogyne incognita TaxID=6306 RepID=A0A914LPV7_MELIC